MQKMTNEEFFAEAERRFGKDRTVWQFVCPVCKTVQTAQDYLKAGFAKKDIGIYLASECLGVRIEGRGCKYSVLTNGPKGSCVEVTKPNGPTVVYFGLADETPAAAQAAIPSPAPEVTDNNKNTEPQPMTTTTATTAAEEQPASPPPANEQQEEGTEMAGKGKPMTDEQKKEAARQRAKEWRDAKKKEAAKAQKETVPIRPTKITAPPVNGTTPVRHARAARKSKGKEVLILRVGEGDAMPTVIPGAPVGSVKEALTHIRIHAAPGTYKVAVVKATKTLMVETKEIRELQ